MLEQSERRGYDSVVSWLPSGKGFKVHDRLVFEAKVLPLYFSAVKLKSFQRQLYFYGFQRISNGKKEKGGYSHPFFVRHDPKSCRILTRLKKKDKLSQASSTAPFHVTSNYKEYLYEPIPLGQHAIYTSGEVSEHNLNVEPSDTTEMWDFSPTIVDEIIEIFGADRSKNPHPWTIGYKQIHTRDIIKDNDADVICVSKLEVGIN